MSDSQFYQPAHTYPAQGSSDTYRPATSNPTHVNPWLKTQQPAVPPGSQAPSNYYNQSKAASSTDERRWDGQSQMGRFVTQDTLDSLKLQQEHYQSMPKNRQYSPSRSQQYRRPAFGAGRAEKNRSAYPVYGSRSYEAGDYDTESYDAGSNHTRDYGAGSYDERSYDGRNYGTGNYGADNYSAGSYGSGNYGAGSVNPYYDSPIVSPWGGGIDVLNQGGSLPMVPSEALGGFSPIYTPSYDMENTNKSNSELPYKSAGSMIFNPFTFLPDGNVQQP